MNSAYPGTKNILLLRFKGVGRMVLGKTGNQKKTGTAILISDRIDFKDCCKRQRRTLHNGQGINPRIRQL